jgi:hypothetical protein
VLLDQLGQVLDIAANHGSGDIVSLFGRVDQFRNPSVGSGRVGKVGELGCDQLKFQAKGYFTYQQCPRMKAGLVLRAFEVCAPQLVDYPVVPPNEAADGDLDEVSEENVGPEFTSTNVLRRELHERRNVAVLVVKIASSNDTNGDQDTAANDTENNEDIPYHPQEPQEEDRIPILSTSSCSFELVTALIQSKGPLPSGCGRCFSSACFARGAYTRLFFGRRKQKTRNSRPVTTKE